MWGFWRRVCCCCWWWFVWQLCNRGKKVRASTKAKEENEIERKKNVYILLCDFVLYFVFHRCGFSVVERENMDKNSVRAIFIGEFRSAEIYSAWYHAASLPCASERDWLYYHKSEPLYIICLLYLFHISIMIHVIAASRVDLFCKLLLDSIRQWAMLWRSIGRCIWHVHGEKVLCCWVIPMLFWSHDWIKRKIYQHVRRPDVLLRIN